MTSFDRRLTPARPDLAARHLEGKVKAARFVDGTLQEVIDAQAPLRQSPYPDAPLDTQVLMGERMLVYEMTEEGWAWGQLETDHYVGWVPSNALAAPGPAPTHRVIALRTFIFPGPSIKVPPFAAPSLGAQLAVIREDGKFAVTASGGYVPKQHLAPLTIAQPDFVAIAERFIGVPYLWGGKTSLGLDCSGLVQISLAACNIAAPRDTDLLEKMTGTPLPPRSGIAALQRGDLIFWKGHIAIIRDRDTLIHANAFHMAVAIEPIAEAITRIRASDGEITSIKRLNIPLAGR